MGLHSKWLDKKVNFEAFLRGFKVVAGKNIDLVTNLRVVRHGLSSNYCEFSVR